MAKDLPGPAPLQRQSLAQQLAERLRSSIFSGHIASGSVLRQAALAREFGVSVIPLREALRQLEGEGLVRHEAHRGVVVAALNAEDVEELSEICTALESLAFQRAIPRIRDEDLDQAASALEALRGEHDLAAFAAHAWTLRSALLRPAGSPRLLQLLESLDKGNRRYYGLILHDAGLRERTLERWLRRIELARARDLRGVLKLLELGRREVVESARALLPHAKSEAEERKK